MSTKQQVVNLRSATPADEYYTPYEQRRLLRIALGSCTGFAICKYMNWPYGVFFVVYPMLLLGMLPVFDRLIACEFLGSIFLNVIEIYLLHRFFLPYPVLMTFGVFFILCVHFHYMAKGKHFFMWAVGVVTLSVLLHYSSYQDKSTNNMIMAVFLATVIAISSAAVLYWLIPEHDQPQLPPKPLLSQAQINHRMLMGAVLATSSFMVFQVLDLQDSLSAQVSSVLVLFPMTLKGSLTSSLKRAKGICFGCVIGLVMQVLMYDLIRYLPLVLLAMFITVMITARLHLVERAGSGLGFGALTTIGILFGQYLQPNNDILYSSMYRFTSVTLALGILLSVAWVLDYFLNRFAATSNVEPPDN
ncbi:DUF2955 domain-containing protein [Alteromonas sp. 14N.309.X.WAT.G.H12]|uniref:DUF2955 domain-containing protein n=1 Tax=Alteromonas sp. 14N.309.X.WAT.G.H12 TaxID=3120824 RepID=UPI002FD1A993